jgi:hypothetical protein
MRRVLFVATASTLAVIVASSALASGDASAAKSLRVRSPAVGHYSVKAFALTAKKRPRLRLLNRKAVPKSLVVAGGIAPDKKRKGRWYAFVIQANRKSTARRVAAVKQASGTFVVIDPSGAEAAGSISLRDAIRNANQDPAADTITFLANPVGTPTAQTILTGVFTNDNSDLLALVEGPGPPPPPASFFCTLIDQRDPVSTTNELNIFTTCNAPAVRSVFTFPPGMTVSAFLPSSCNASGNVLICPSLVAPAGSPFEVDARFGGSLPPSMPFSELVTAQSGATATVNGTGPP